MIFPWAICAYLAGMALVKSGDTMHPDPTMMAVLLAVGLILVIFLRRSRIASIVLVLCFIPLGALLYLPYRNIENPVPVEGLARYYTTGEPLRLYGEIATGPFKFFNKDAVVVQVYVVESRSGIFSHGARALVFIPPGWDYKAWDGVSFDCSLGDPTKYWNSPQGLKYRITNWCVAQSGSVRPYEISNPARQWFSRFKERLLSHLQVGIDDNLSTLFQGIVFGKEAQKLDPETVQSFTQAGISHLIVASGSQVALMIFPFFTLYDRTRSRWLRAMLLISIGLSMILLYLIVGHTSSILRALSVGFVILFGRSLNRQSNSLNSMSFAGLLWLVINPALIRSIGFLLSYAASFGILYMAPIITQAVGRRFRWSTRGRLHQPAIIVAFRWGIRNLIYVLIITLASQWAVLPIIAWKLRVISLTGLAANLFAVPAGSIVLLLGAISGVAGFISPSLSYAINLSALPFLDFMTGVANFFSGMTWLTIQPVKVYPVAVVAYYVITIWIIETARRGADFLTYISMLRGRNSGK